MQFPKGILFDFDGTLVDSERFHFDSARELFEKEFGVSFDWEYYIKKMAGIPLSKSAPDVIEEFNLPINAEALVHAMDAHTREKYDNESVSMMPHALEAITYFEGQDCLLGVVTGSGRRDVTLTLERLGLLDRFKLLVTHDDVENVKPHGEPYLKGVSGLGLPKEAIVAFEDSPNGMTSAINAGLTCIGIQHEPLLRNRMTHGTMLCEGFDEVIRYFEGLQD